MPCWSASVPLHKGAVTGGQVQFSEDQLLALNLTMLQARSAEAHQVGMERSAPLNHPPLSSPASAAAEMDAADTGLGHPNCGGSALQQRQSTLASFGRMDNSIVRARMDPHQIQVEVPV